MALDADAALELSVVGMDLTNSKAKTPAWWKSSVLYAVAYLDPLAKQSTGNLSRHERRKMYFPVSSSVLLSPEAASHATLTLELLSPSRLPFHCAKLLATAKLPLSLVRLSTETFALPLLKPSGRSAGSITVAARVLWDLGFRREEEPLAAVANCPSAPSMDLMATEAPEVSSTLGSEGSDPPRNSTNSSLASSMEEPDRVASNGIEDGGGEDPRTGVPDSDLGAWKVVIGAVGALVVGLACSRLRRG